MEDIISLYHNILELLLATAANKSRITIDVRCIVVIMLVRDRDDVGFISYGSVLYAPIKTSWFVWVGDYSNPLLNDLSNIYQKCDIYHITFALFSVVKTTVIASISCCFC